MIKEAVEDYKRYRQDVEVNNRSVEAYSAADGKFVTKRWADVRVGDVIIVFKVRQGVAVGGGRQVAAGGGVLGVSSGSRRGQQAAVSTTSRQNRTATTVPTTGRVLPRRPLVPVG